MNSSEKRRILLAEDDDSLRESLATVLTEHGYTVHAAANGEEALSLLETEKPDALILDIMMPVVDGFDVLRTMQAQGVLRSTPVIVLSSLSQPEEEHMVLELGATKFVSKLDTSPADMLLHVEEVLGKQRT